MSNDTDRPKRIKREPWCWLEKRKLKMIADIFQSKKAAAARSLYLALCETASDKQSETFETSQRDLAHRAALSISTVKRILPVLQQVGLVTITRKFENKIETRSVYTLIRGAVAHGEQALAQQSKTKRATEEESFEESFEDIRALITLDVNNTLGGGNDASSIRPAKRPHRLDYDSPDGVVRCRDCSFELRLDEQNASASRQEFLAGCSNGKPKQCAA